MVLVGELEQVVDDLLRQSWPHELGGRSADCENVTSFAGVIINHGPQRLSLGQKPRVQDHYGSIRGKSIVRVGGVKCQLLGDIMLRCHGGIGQCQLLGDIVRRRSGGIGLIARNDQTNRSPDEKSFGRDADREHHEYSCCSSSSRSTANSH